ncbi:MAG: 23S rRNA (pseudouridine(1915)-N(3))-methyltransferase RlmH [Bryobacteraceae bacterium]|nr:23S rRNA (pseudouridine(1915)-N(3))-methyltransferase RlmH [Bryobacteraceae bacterium]
MKLFLFYIGRAKDEHANALAREFIRRSTRYMAVEMREIDPRRYDLFARHSTARKVFLDPLGEQWNSARFAQVVRQAEFDAQDLVFLIGGHAGLDPGWRSRADSLVSLTPLTLPHEFARVILAEQIYRALTTLRGHPYPR